MTQRQHGFTLLEVMIAVVILAVGLAALFTSEAGAVKLAQRARTTTIASLLARCKMGEVEEKVAKEGWPGDIIEGNDECCEDGEQDGYSCDWKVERIKLPDTEDDDSDDSDDKDGKDQKSGSGGSSGKPVGVIDQMAELSKTDPSERLSGLTDMLTNTAKGKSEKDGDDQDGYSESTLDPISSMVMDMAFPIMKPVIEEGVRRASVLVKWKEGQRDQTFELVQFLVSEQQIILPGDDEDAVNAAGGTTPGSTTPATTSTPASTPASKTSTTR